MAEQTRLTRFLRGYAEKIPDEDVRLFAMAVVDELDEDARSDQGTIKILGDLKNRIDALETKEKARAEKKQNSKQWVQWVVPVLITIAVIVKDSL